ncbi:MAG: hypothetical protein QW478_08480, partial [Candidatus Micrarchaeaceae archaeon]
QGWRNMDETAININGVKLSLSKDEIQQISEGVIPSGIKERMNTKEPQLLPILYEYIPRRIWISKQDGIYATLQNGNEGALRFHYIDDEKPEKSAVKAILRFIGEIGPVVRINGDKIGIRYDINGTKDVNSIDDFIVFMRQKLALTTPQVQLLRQAMDAYVLDEVAKGNIEEYLSSPVIVIDGKIIVNYHIEIDLGAILKTLRDFYNKASHQQAYIATLGWALLAPIHAELKRRSKAGILTPSIIMTGKTKGGKTSLGRLFIGHGFAQEQDDYFYPYNRTYTRFSLMKHLSETNLPAVFDDVPTSWIFLHKEDLKAYSGTNHWGDRGRGDQTLTEYLGERSFLITINDEFRIDDDLALALRLIVLRFDERERQRRDLNAWLQFFNSLSEGFMFPLINAVLGGIDISKLVEYAERFEKAEDWVNYALNLLNLQCDKYGIERFPVYEATRNETLHLTNAMEIAQAFIAEYDRIRNNEEETTQDDGDNGEMLVKKMKYRSKIEGEFKIESRQESIGDKPTWRKYIYFTGSAFKTLVMMQGLRCPYSNAANFLNNISSDDGVRVEYGGKLISKRLGDNNDPLKVYCISIPEEPEDNKESDA